MTSTTTRKALITAKYATLRAEVSAINPALEPLFPSLADIDLVDAIFFMNMSFTEATEPAVRQSVIELASTFGSAELSAEEIDRLVPTITKFVGWFKALQ